MHLADIMSRDVRTVRPEEPVTSAWALMRTHGIHHLVVMSSAHDVAGIVSARDLGGRRGPSPTDARTVAEVMATDVVSAAPETTLRRAANLMRNQSLGCLPVLANGRVIGILTLADVLELVGRGVERPVARSKRYTLRHRAGGQAIAAPQRRRRP